MAERDEEYNKYYVSDKTAFIIFSITYLIATIALFCLIGIEFLAPEKLLIEAKAVNPYLTRIYVILGGLSVLLFFLFYIMRFMLYPFIFLYFHNKKTNELGFAIMMNKISFATTVKMKVFKVFCILLAFSPIVLCISSQIILYGFMFF